MTWSWGLGPLEHSNLLKSPFHGRSICKGLVRIDQLRRTWNPSNFPDQKPLKRLCYKLLGTFFDQNASLMNFNLPPVSSTRQSSPICLQLLACFQMPWRSKLPLLRLFVLLTSVERCKVRSESCQSRLAVQNDRVTSQMVRPTEILDRIIFIGPPTHQIYRV